MKDFIEMMKQVAKEEFDCELIVSPGKTSVKDIFGFDLASLMRFEDYSVSTTDSLSHSVDFDANILSVTQFMDDRVLQFDSDFASLSDMPLAA